MATRKRKKPSNDVSADEPSLSSSTNGDSFPPPPKPPGKGSSIPPPPSPRRPVDDGEALHIVVMDPFDQDAKYSETALPTLPLGKARFARLFASYGGARVTAHMRLHSRGKEPPTEFGKIIKLHERIKSSSSSTPKAR